MNIGRIVGVVLSVLFAFSYINNNINKEDNNSFELIGDSGYVTNNEVSYENTTLNESNSSNVETIKYTNNQPYSIDIATSNISIDCNGSNTSDVEMVKNNMKVKALFSKTKDGKKVSNINIESKETIYIYVVNEYVGDTYPNSNVTCNYSIDIQDF